MCGIRWQQDEEAVSWRVLLACLRYFLRGARYERANMRRHRSEGDSLSGGHRSQARDVNMGPGAASFLVALLTDDVAVRLNSTGGDHRAELGRVPRLCQNIIFEDSGVSVAFTVML